MLRLINALLVILAFAACSTPEMGVDSSLTTTATVYPVKGRQGWLVNQHLSFGEYKTSKVSRSWTKGYDYPFLVRFSGAKEKLSYDISGEGQTASVFCMAKLAQTDLRIFNELFDINLKTNDVFSGTIAVENAQPFNFYVANLNQNNWFQEAEGTIANNTFTIAIRPVKTLANGKTMLSQQVPGFEFVLDGKVVGAVETLNQGRIWLQNDLSKEVKIALAGVSCALLLRSDLNENIDA